MDNKSPQQFSDPSNCNSELESFSQILEFLIIKNLDCASKKTAQDSGLVIALDAKWGSGKTTFLDMFEHKIRQNKDREAGYIYSHNFTKIDSINRDNTGKMWNAKITEERKKVVIIRYNAWENDYFDDPFMSLVGQFCKQFPDSNEEKLKTFKEKALVVCKSMIPLLSKIASKVTSTAVLSMCGDPLLAATAAETIGSTPDMIKAYNDLQSKVFDEKLNSCCSLTRLIEEFKEALVALSKGDKEDSIVLFLIDELDRCKPQFAVNLLEILKHFFSVPNTVFLIALDKSVLVEHIKHYHGNIDGEHYLSRLFDFELSLPTDSENFYIDLWRQSGLSLPNDASLPEIRNFFAFSSREWIKYLNNLKHLAKIPTWNRPEMYILLAIKMHNKAVYKYICELSLIRDNQVSDASDIELIYKDFLKRINNQYSSESHDTILGANLKTWLRKLFESVFWCNRSAPNHIKKPDLDKSNLIGIIRTIDHMF